MSKKKVMIETHGKVENFQATTLEQVWAGNNELSRYGTIDAAVYEDRLTNMTRSDIEHEARMKGGIIVESTARIKDRLMTDFRAYVSLLRKPVSQAVTMRADTATQNAALKVLSEGR